MSRITTAEQTQQTRTGAVLRQLREPGFWAEWTAVVALIILVFVFGIASPTFLSWGNVQAILVAAAILVMLSVGQADRKSVV